MTGELEARIVANALAADDHAVQLDLFGVAS